MSDEPIPFATVEEALEEIRQGRQIVLVDDEDRENEGDLTMAAEKITPEAINFMAKYGRGLVCLALTEERCDDLALPLMTPVNTSNYGTAFCESIDARRGTTTGISTADRAMTILTAIDAATRPADLARPGHVFPLRARHGGVLVRAGQTEASVDLARIAGLTPAGVICEIMNDDGTMARLPQLAEFCRTHGLKLLTVAELIRYRMRNERYVRRVAEAALPTRYGDFRMIVYASDVDREQHIALVRGDLSGRAAAGARAFALPHRRRFCVHRMRLPRNYRALARSHRRENRGVFVYLHHTGAGLASTPPRLPLAPCRTFCIIRAASLIRMRAATAAAARKRHRRANSDRPRPQKPCACSPITRAKLSHSKAMASPSPTKCRSGPHHRKNARIRRFDLSRRGGF